jgi:hypothetical protein
MIELKYECLRGSYDFNGLNNFKYLSEINGWTVSPIYIYFSGRPFDGFAGSNLNGTHGDTHLPIDARNANRYPSIWNLDLRLSKRFRFTERYNVEVLAEGFNIFNRTQVATLNNTRYSVTNGTTATPTLTYLMLHLEISHLLIITYTANAKSSLRLVSASNFARV